MHREAAEDIQQGIRDVNTEIKEWQIQEYEPVDFEVFVIGKL